MSLLIVLITLTTVQDFLTNFKTGELLFQNTFIIIIHHEV